jgi:hypothetical protein
MQDSGMKIREEVQNVATSTRLAVREHLASGKPITELESVVLFGVTSLPQVISLMRKEGWVMQSRRIPYLTAVKRINEFAELHPPKNLPVREIMLTEYWTTP